MYINMIELKHLMKKRQYDKSYIGQPFGSAIRFRRKALNLTLEEASDGICSLSYLSKVENNAITASEEFIEKFKERFNLKDAYDFDNESFEEHLNVIVQSCLKDELISSDLLLHYEDRIDYQSMIVEFSIHVLNKNHQKALSIFKDLMYLITSMPQDAFAITIILLNRILYDQMRHSDGIELLKMLKSQGFYHSEIELLIKKWHLKHGFKANRFSYVLKHYETYKAELVEKHLFNQVKKLDIDRLDFEAKYFPTEYMKEEVSKIIKLDQHEIEYLIAKNHYHQGDYEKVIAYSHKYLDLNPKWYILHLLSLDYLKRSKDIFKILKDNDYLDHMKVDMIQKHLTLKYKANQSEIIEYIKKDILVSELSTDDYDLLVYLMNDCEKILSKFQFYKDAVHVYRHFTTRLNQNMLS